VGAAAAARGTRPRGLKIRLQRRLRQTLAGMAGGYKKGVITKEDYEKLWYKYWTRGSPVVYQRNKFPLSLQNQNGAW
jgi:hypothetical protein